MYARRAPAALLAPSFWVALLVLALNDHVLKATSPGWLTGKLSDFAGLIVAPVVAAELCRGRWRRLRLWAAGAVVFVFVLTELSPTCAAAVSRVFGTRLWPDPTDLFALAVLPWTWHLLSRPSAPLRLPGLQRAMLAFAALVCVATTAPTLYVPGPYLVNHSGGRTTVHVAWLEAEQACSAPLRELARDSASLEVIDEQDFPLEFEAAMSLDTPTENVDDAVGKCPQYAGPPRSWVDAGPSCRLLRVSFDGGPESLVRADRNLPASEDPVPCRERVRVYEAPGEGALVIQHDGTLRAYEHMEAVPTGER